MSGPIFQKVLYIQTFLLEKSCFLLIKRIGHFRTFWNLLIAVPSLEKNFNEKKFGVSVLFYVLN